LWVDFREQDKSELGQAQKGTPMSKPGKEPDMKETWIKTLRGQPFSNPLGKKNWRKTLKEANGQKTWAPEGTGKTMD